MTDNRLAGYEPVQARLARFWADHELGRIGVELVERDDKHVLAKASIWRNITDPIPAVEGWASEVHDGSPVNRQGWMIENAETSAIGRALANLGYAPHQAPATAEDMDRVIERQRQELAAATATMDRLKKIKGTDLAAEIKALAAANGKYMASLSDRTLAQLTGDAEWRAMVDDLLDGYPSVTEEP